MSKVWALREEKYLLLNHVFVSSTSNIASEFVHVLSFKLRMVLKDSFVDNDEALLSR